MAIEIRVEDTLLDEEDAERFVKMFNGIYHYIVEEHGFAVGMRNTIAVDFGIICHMLGKDAWNDFFYFWNNDKEPFLGYDDERTEDRFERVDDYLDVWERDPAYYMIERNYWLELSNKADEYMTIVE